VRWWAQVHVVTEEEAAAGKYEVWDIVLPMPGEPCGRML
jgi:hypothetical protein